MKNMREDFQKIKDEAKLNTMFGITIDTEKEDVDEIINFLHSYEIRQFAHYIARDEAECSISGVQTTDKKIHILFGKISEKHTEYGWCYCEENCFDKFGIEFVYVMNGYKPAEKSEDKACNEISEDELVVEDEKPKEVDVDTRLKEAPKAVTPDYIIKNLKRFESYWYVNQAPRKIEEIGIKNSVTFADSAGMTCIILAKDRVIETSTLFKNTSRSNQNG